MVLRSQSHRHPHSCLILVQFLWHYCSYCVSFVCTLQNSTLALLISPMWVNLHDVQIHLECLALLSCFNFIFWSGTLVLNCITTCFGSVSLVWLPMLICTTLILWLKKLDCLHGEREYGIIDATVCKEFWGHWWTYSLFLLCFVYYPCWGFFLGDVGSQLHVCTGICHHFFFLSFFCRLKIEILILVLLCWEK